MCLGATNETATAATAPAVTNKAWRSRKAVLGSVKSSTTPLVAE